MPCFQTVEKRNKSRKKNYAQTQVGNFNSGKNWSRFDITIILKPEGFLDPNGNPYETDRQLSKILGRSVQAIQEKRSRLKEELK
jgi:hypothetical protein